MIIIVKVALALGALALVLLIARNLGARLDFRASQRKAWDEPLREGSAVILSAAPSAWWWLVALGAVTAVVARVLFERVGASGHGASFSWWLLFLVLAGVTGRRLVQLSEQVKVTWNRIESRTLLGPRYALDLTELTGVTEDDRTVLLAFRDGRAVELSPWLDGRFWLGRQLRARLGDGG